MQVFVWPFELRCPVFRQAFKVFLSRFVFIGFIRCHGAHYSLFRVFNVISNKWSHYGGSVSSMMFYMRIV